MELNFTDTYFVKSNEHCMNLKTQTPASLANTPVNTPIPVTIISQPYIQSVKIIGNLHLEREFVNVTDGVENYRVMKKHIEESLF